jgi:hypothetical protein
MVYIYINIGRLFESLSHIFHLNQWKGHTLLVSTHTTHIHTQTHGIVDRSKPMHITISLQYHTNKSFTMSEVMHCVLALLPVSKRHMTSHIVKLVFIYSSHAECKEKIVA